MNWCKYLGHKWENYTELIDITNNQLVIIPNSSNFTFMPYTEKVATEFRVCKRCYYKQRKTIMLGGWVKQDLTEAEIRDKKLKQLGLK
jgi:C4-type Zn-finger protein